MKKNLCSLFLLLIFPSDFLSAQNTFQERIDSTLSIIDALLSYDGNLIVGSNYPVNPSFLDRAPNLTKIDMNGDVLWSKSYVYNLWYESPRVESISLMKDSGFAILGEIVTGNFEEEVVVIHSDKNGNLVWSKRIGSTFYYVDDYCASIISSSDGGVIYCGRIFNNNTNNGDACIVKISVSGEIVWSYSYGEAYFESGIVILETGDGGFLISGEQEIDSSYTGYPMIFKIDSIGNMLWAKRYEDSLRINDLIALEDGFAGCGYENFEALLLKFDNEGNMLWNKQFEFTDFPYPGEITATTDNGFLLGCYTSSVIKCDSLGNLQWLQQYGDSTKSATYLPLVAPDGSYFYCGIAGVDNYGGLIKSTDNGITFCDERAVPADTVQTIISVYSTTLTRTNLNYFSVDYSLSTVIDTLNTIVLCTNTGINNQDENYTRSLFPNPFFSSTTISFSLQKNSRVSLVCYNLIGQKVKTILQNEKQTPGQHEYSLDFAAEGVYLVTLTVDGISSSQKIICQK